MIWPAVRLNDSSEYLVAIKNLKHTNGSSVLPSKAFRALRLELSSDLYYFKQICDRTVWVHMYTTFPLELC